VLIVTSGENVGAGGPAVKGSRAATSRASPYGAPQAVASAETSQAVAAAW